IAIPGKCHVKTSTVAYTQPYVDNIDARHQLSLTCLAGSLDSYIHINQSVKLDLSRWQP
ncbi:hypothetical protein BgiMline_020027, partial [Biomphalaria glabrata]